MSNTFNLKHGIEPKDLQRMSPKLFIVWGYFTLFATERDLPIEVTNIKEKFNVSVSNTHPEGRAIDVSVRDWSILEIGELKGYLEAKVGHLGAISLRTNKPRVVVYHDAGLGSHFHLQVSP
jgi:hypothetical protein